MNIKIVISKGNKIFEKDLNFKLKRFENTWTIYGKNEATLAQIHPLAQFI